MKKFLSIFYVILSFQIAAAQPASEVLDRIEVQEDATSVSITPYVDPRDGSEDACNSYLKAKVELELPVDSRTFYGTGVRYHAP